MAFAAAEQIQEFDSKALAIARVAERFAIEQQFTEASHSLANAVALADHVSQDAQQAEFYLAVSRTYSHLGRFREARLAADRCPNSRYRLAAYTSLLTQYASS